MAHTSSPFNEQYRTGPDAAPPRNPRAQLLAGRTEPVYGSLLPAERLDADHPLHLDGYGLPLPPTLSGSANAESVHVGAGSPRAYSVGHRDRLAAATILIIDDCTLQRETLSGMLVNAGVPTPTTASDLASVVDATCDKSVDIVLLSMATRDKITLLRVVGEACPRAKVIVVGISEDDEDAIIACAEAGVAGYHLRTESLFDLLRLISRVADDESFCSPRVSAILLKHLSSMAAERRSGPVEIDLTAREMQILRMLENGLSNRDIADRLCITLHTVKNHVHAVLSKLGVSTRAQAAALSRRMQ